MNELTQEEKDLLWTYRVVKITDLNNFDMYQVQQLRPRMMYQSIFLEPIRYAEWVKVVEFENEFSAVYYIKSKTIAKTEVVYPT